MSPTDPLPAPSLDVRADLSAYPWERSTAENTTGGYVMGVGLDRDPDGRALAVVLVQVSPNHYVMARTSLALAAQAARTLSSAPIARDKGTAGPLGYLVAALVMIVGSALLLVVSGVVLRQSGVTWGWVLIGLGVVLNAATAAGVYRMARP